MTSAATEERTKRFQDLLNALESFSQENFDPFEIYRAHYESAGIQIGVDVMVPKTGVAPLARPVIVRIHGGFLITGSSLFPAWFSKWILQYAIIHGAVIVSPNYRLLPEAEGREILNDFQEFWSWFGSGGPQQHLMSVGRSDIILDADRHLLIGESAGGYLAIQSVLSQFTRPRAVIALYPMLDMKSEFYTTRFEKPICGVPNFPDAIVDEFLASRSKQSAITEADPPSRLAVALAVVQNGRLLELLGEDPSLFPLRRLVTLGSSPRSRQQSLLPPLCIFHGAQDSAVPMKGTLKFVETLRRVDPTAKLKIVIRPGDHGFDAFATPDDGWLSDALTFATKEWLGGALGKI